MVETGDRVGAGSAPDPVATRLGDAGSVYVYRRRRRRPIDLGAGRLQPLAGPTWEKVVLTTQEQLDNFYPNIGNISDSDARAIGILVVLNDVRAEVSASIDNADVTAGGVRSRPPRRRRSARRRRAR